MSSNKTSTKNQEWQAKFEIETPIGKEAMNNRKKFGRDLFNANKAFELSKIVNSDAKSKLKCALAQRESAQHEVAKLESTELQSAELKSAQLQLLRATEVFELAKREANEANEKFEKAKCEAAKANKKYDEAMKIVDELTFSNLWVQSSFITSMDNKPSSGHEHFENIAKKHNEEMEELNLAMKTMEEQINQVFTELNLAKRDLANLERIQVHLAELNLDEHDLAKSDSIKCRLDELKLAKNDLAKRKSDELNDAQENLRHLQWMHNNAKNNKLAAEKNAHEAKKVAERSHPLLKKRYLFTDSKYRKIFESYSHEAIRFYDIKFPGIFNKESISNMETESSI